MKDLFFNGFITLGVEALFSYFITGYLSFTTIQYTSFGEILDSIYTYFCITLIFGNLIFLLILIATKNHDQIIQQENQEQWGSFFRYIKVKFFIDRIYYLIFILRRYLYIAVFLLYRNYPGLLLSFFYIQNLLYSLYAGASMHFKSSKINRQELFNYYRII